MQFIIQHTVSFPEYLRPVSVCGHTTQSPDKHRRMTEITTDPVSSLFHHLDGLLLRQSLQSDLTSLFLGHPSSNLEDAKIISSKPSKRPDFSLPARSTYSSSTTLSNSSTHRILPLRICAAPSRNSRYRFEGPSPILRTSPRMPCAFTKKVHWAVNLQSTRVLEAQEQECEALSARKERIAATISSAIDRCREHRKIGGLLGVV